MIKITKLQQEMLKYRLDIPCAIKEVFADTEHLSDISEQAIESAIDVIEKAVNNGQLCNKTMKLNFVEKELLIDIVDGSTFFANVDQEETAYKAHAINRSADNLEEKIFEEFKIITNFPRG